MRKKQPDKQRRLSFLKEARTLFDAANIPQADNLGRVRSVVAAVGAGVTTAQGFLDATGMSERHVAYNRRAAIILGLVLDGSPFQITKLGQRLLQTESDSAEEREAFRGAMLAAPALQPFRDFFQSAEHITKESLGYRIGVMTGLSKETAERRAQCLLAWRRFAVGDNATPAATLAHEDLAKQIHEQIEALNAKARESYLEELQRMKPAAFEKLVARLSSAMGYVDVKVVGGPGDGGVDVMAVRVDAWKKRHKVIIQAKRYRKTVGRRFVHELMGVMEAQRCEEALLMSTGTFGHDALEAVASKSSLTLVDGRALVEKLIEHSIGMLRDAHGAIVPAEPRRSAKATTS